MTRKDRAYAAAVLGSVLALILVVVMVFQFGQHHPSPPSLQDHPNLAIPGTLVYFDKDGCIIRVAASGGIREKTYCASKESRGLITWVDSHTVAYQLFTKPEVRWVIVDLDTKAMSEVTGPSASPPQVFPGGRGLTSIRGESVDVDGKTGKVFVVSEGKRMEIADFEVREYGGPEPLTWSPDGDWMLLAYHPPRDYDRSELWILSRDGQRRGTLAKDLSFSGASWWIEGLGAMPKVDGVPAAK